MSDLHSSSPAEHGKQPVKELPPAASNVLGIEFAMELGTILAVPAVVFGLGGRFLDKYMGTGNLFFLLFIGLAFVTSFMTAYKKVREIMAKMPKDLPRKKLENVDPEIAKEQEILHDLFRPPSA